MHMQVKEQPTTSPFDAKTLPALRPSLFSTHCEPDVGQRLMSAGQRKRIRAEVGLDRPKAKGDNRNLVITPQAYWYQNGQIDSGIVIPENIYDWAMLVLNRKESVCGVIVNPIPRDKSSTPRQGFRLTRHAEFVEGVYWDNEVLIDIRAGILDVYCMPRHAKIMSVDLDTPVNRDTGAYFEVDVGAWQSFQLTYSETPINGRHCHWERLHVDTDYNTKNPPVHIGSFYEDNKFSDMMWSAFVNTFKRAMEPSMSAPEIEARLDKMEMEVAEATDTKHHSVFPITARAHGGERANFWPRVFKVNATRQLQQLMAFSVSHGLTVIGPGHVEVYKLVTAFDELWSVIMEKAETEPLVAMEAFKQAYIKLIFDVREALSIK